MVRIPWQVIPRASRLYPTARTGGTKPTRCIGYASSDFAAHLWSRRCGQLSRASRRRNQSRAGAGSSRRGRCWTADASSLSGTALSRRKMRSFAPGSCGWTAGATYFGSRKRRLRWSVKARCLCLVAMQTPATGIAALSACVSA